MRAVAINVGANTNSPGFRGPVHPDGRFSFVPIPETAPTVGSVPTYGDLAPELDCAIPEDLWDTPVHLDPTFAEYPCCDRYTYGDPHGVKARPLLDLAAGDRVYFYATLSVTAPAAWLPPGWGAFLIGHFTLERDPVSGEAYRSLDPAARAAFAGNAHLAREEMDAAVLLAGDPENSRLYERAVPLSLPAGGTEASDLVTVWSSDSGRGPWWRRPLRFDDRGTATLRERLAGPHPAENYQG